MSKTSKTAGKSKGKKPVHLATATPIGVNRKFAVLVGPDGTATIGRGVGTAIPSTGANLPGNRATAARVKITDGRGYTIREGDGYDWAGTEREGADGASATNAVVKKLGKGGGMFTTAEVVDAVAKTGVQGRGGEPYSNAPRQLGYLAHRQLIAKNGKGWVLTPDAVKRIAAVK